jgi:hypothetical protein
MFETIAVLVVLLVAIPSLMFWLLRPRNETPGSFHREMDWVASAGGDGHLGDSWSSGSDGGGSP